MSAVRLRIFVSSVQREFQDIRRDLKAFLLGDAFLRRFISEVFLFEEHPATDRTANDVYLAEVERCSIYLGLFGYEYGNEDEEGVSPTEREYDHATKKKKQRLVYIWGTEEKQRHPKMKQLIRKASNDLIRRRVQDYNALTSEIYASLVDYLEERGALRAGPFDATVCDGASLRHFAGSRIAWFLETARRERGFPLKQKTSAKALLTHLNLLEDGKPLNAAVLLFAANPQRFHRTAETKCVHCHGTEYQRPFASQQIYGETLFEQVEQARDFVLAKLGRAVGTRTSGVTAPATYELPHDAVSEAIVNAVCHRDYYSNASVEVRLFADRLEVWNPGTLPGTLTLDSLRVDHPSVPQNPLVAESLYLARYIEKAGSGTQAMIEACCDVGLPEPDFEQRGSSFVVTLWRDWLTNSFMTRLGLSARQKKGMAVLRDRDKLTSGVYQKETGVSRQTASRDLEDLVQKGVLERRGEKKATHYVKARSMPQI